jgi:2,3-bisphosphoglycerate-dependent phosphoglycerate mutase
MYKLVIVRHGESVWNKENIFTGWTDIELSDLGRKQAQKAGEILKQANYDFDLAFVSVLKRAEDTLSLILKELDLKIPIERAWQLNERHYGALQGLNKDEIKEKYGEKLFKQWRRSYDVRPPALEKTDSRYSGHDPQYAGLSDEQLPRTESLKDTEKRVMPYWEKQIIPKIFQGQKIIICAHGNSIRALAKNIEKISDQEIPNLEIPLGQPFVYEFNQDLDLIKKFYL